jgi:hypothetical protein
MIFYLCVLIVFSLYQESKLILPTNPLLVQTHYSPPLSNFQFIRAFFSNPLDVVLISMWKNDGTVGTYVTVGQSSFNYTKSQVDGKSPPEASIMHCAVAARLDSLTSTSTHLVNMHALI